MAPSLQAVDVALRDGSTVRVRPVEPGDRDGLLALLSGMSEQSRWFRFLSAGANLDRAARYAAEPRDGAGLVVAVGAEERIVAHAEFAREAPARAEVAFEVADEWHGRGIATILLAHLAGVAERMGLETFVAYVHPSNRRMVGVFRESGFPVEVRSDAGELTVEMPAALGAAARERFEDRDRRAAAAAVTHVLRPATVAVLGTGTPAADAVLANLRGGGYTGAVHSGEPVPEGTELALIAGSPDEVLAQARACAAAGVRALVILSGGYADAGEDGRQRLAALLAICRRAGMRLVGPSSLGVLDTDPDVRLAAVSAPVEARPGPVALASQSGAIGVAAMAEAARRAIGLSSFASTGDKADLSGNDFLQYWEGDERTRVVLLYLESFGNPRRFGRIARRVARAKPVVVVKSGRRAAAATPGVSRTRALLGASEVTTAALFEHAGIIRTDTVSEQLDVAALLAGQPLPQGDRVAIVANARGPGITCADACAAAGLAPGEPLDARGDYAAAIASAAPSAGAVIAIAVPLLGTRLEDVAAGLRAAAPELARTGKPLLGVVMATDERRTAELGSELGAPVYRTPEDAVRALARAARYARWRAEPPDEPGAAAGTDADAAAAVIAAALERGGGWLAPAEVDALLRAYGIPLVETRTAATPQEAAHEAAAIGFPVAVKALCSTLAHRSDVGAVALGVAGAADVERAAAGCAEAVRRAGGEPEGFVVQPMVPAGTELVVGALTDPDVGPIVACGPGGRAVELLGDVAVRLAPLGPRGAAALLRSLRSFPLLEGYRGAEPADVGALEDVVVRVSALAGAHAEVVEIDCDPVLAGRSGALVADARVRVAPPSGTRPFPALDR